MSEVEEKIPMEDAIIEQKGEVEEVEDQVSVKPRAHSGGLVLKHDLTGRQKRFCEEYVYDWNATRAMIVAFSANNERSSIKELKRGSACSMALKLLGKVGIQNYIDELQKNVEKRCGLSQAMVVDEYKKLAFSNIADLHNSWIDKKEFDQLTKDEKACISEINTRVTKKVIGSRNNEPVYRIVEEVRVKLHDKMKALDGLRKMLGYDAPEKVEGTINMNHREVNEIPVEELSEKAQDLLFEISQKQLTDGTRDN